MLRVVVDTNKIIAALLREGRVRRIFFHPGLEVLLPEYVLEEIAEHREEITRRVPGEALDLLLAKLARRVRVITVEEVDEGILERARRVAKSFDLDDYPFIAAAMSCNAIIWTNDKDLIRQGLVSGEYIAVDTWAVEKLLGGEKLANLLGKLKEKYLTTR